MIIGDISKSGGSIACIEPAIGIFKKFIEKIRIENAKSAKEQSDKAMEF